MAAKGWLTRIALVAACAVMATTGVRAEDGVPSAEALRADFEARNVEFFVDGTRAPEGGLSADGTCDDGSRAASVAIAVPPPGTADFFTDTAFVCVRGRSYWVHRTGGFAGVSLWVGPFDVPARSGDDDRRDENPTTDPETDPEIDPRPAPLPMPPEYQDGAPTRVRPGVVRLRKRGRALRRTLRIRRPVEEQPGQRTRVRRGDYDLADFELGDDVTVLRVVRASRRGIRLRVRIEEGAQPGMRDVSVRGRVGQALLRLR